MKTALAIVRKPALRVLQTFLWMSGGLVVLVCGLGCDVMVRERSSPRETVYVQQQPDYVVIQEAPPPIIVERRSPAPGHGHVWIDGYWNWSGQRYSWQSGHWTTPPHGRASWVSPRYERHGHGYRHVPGHWR